MNVRDEAERAWLKKEAKRERQRRRYLEYQAKRTARWMRRKLGIKQATLLPEDGHASVDNMTFRICNPDPFAPCSRDSLEVNVAGRWHRVDNLADLGAVLHYTRMRE